MAIMDLELYKDTLRATIEEVLTKGDDSIIKSSNAELVAFFNNNATSLTDDVKARYYSDFLTTTVTSTITQAIQVAGNIALQYELEKPVNEQKIISMQNEDLVNRNRVAMEMAKAKIEIEQLIPAQVDKMRADADVAIKELEVKVYQLEQMLPLEKAKLEATTNLAIKELEFKTIELEQKLPVEIARIEADLAMMEQKVLIEKEQLKLAKEELQIKKAQMKLTEAEIDLKREQIRQGIEQLLLEQKKVTLMDYELQMKMKDAEAQRELVGAQTSLANNQSEAVMKSLEVQYQIEEARNEKDVAVAEIYVGAKA